MLFLMACSSANNEGNGGGGSPVKPVDPQVQPDGRLPLVVLEDYLRFVTWGDALNEVNRNTTGLLLHEPTRVLQRLEFGSGQRKFIQVLSVNPRVTCQSGLVSRPRLTLVKAGQGESLEGGQMIALEPETEYALEISLDLECESADGVLETVVWTGRNENIEPAVGIACQDLLGSTLTWFTGDNPAVFRTKENKLFDRANVCGTPVDPERTRCTVQHDGYVETLSCENRAAEADVEFRLTYDRLRETIQSQCLIGGQVDHQGESSYCAERILDRKDYR